MRILTLVVFFIIAQFNLIAQVRPSISNLLRYGNGERSLGSTINSFSYFENLTDARFSFPENVTVGFRLLFDTPPEVGIPFEGISRRYIEYKKDNLKLRIGNSSEIYGRGLVLNLFENRGLAYDTWVDGIKASYKYKNLKTSIIAGTINYKDSVNIYRLEKYRIKGGNIEYKLIPNLKLGFSFIGAEADIPQINKINVTTKAELPELYFDFTVKNMNLFFSWAHKWTHSPDLSISSNGFGIYSSIDYTEGPLGITIDYKNYRFDVQNPFLRDDVTRTTKFMPFQNPPIVMKEHSYTLLSRALHQIDFNDEVGIQIDAIYAFNEDFNINLNFSLSSRQDKYNYNSSIFGFERIDRNSNVFPSSDKRFSPFLEFYSEAEYYFDNTNALRLGFAHRTKTFYNDFTGLLGTHTIKSTVIPMQFEYQLDKNFSTLLQYEFEAVNDNYNTGQENFNNQFISFIASLYSKLSLTLRYEYTNNNFDPSGRNDWLIGEVGYRISGANLVALSYGRERGGQICSNGICRYILPFKGFRFSLQTTI